MDIFSVLETFGVPVTMSIAFGFFIWKQNKFIQDELQKELRESFERVEGIIIKLIDAQKGMQMKQEDIKASFHAIVEILSSLSGNGLKEKFGRRDRKY
jgi:hypothetical protein